MGDTEVFSSPITLNKKHPPYCDVIVAIATAVRCSFLKVTNSLVILLCKTKKANSRLYA
jgi:hypothetical protein